MATSKWRAFLVCLCVMSVYICLRACVHLAHVSPLSMGSVDWQTRTSCMSAGAQMFAGGVSALLLGCVDLL